MTYTFFQTFMPDVGICTAFLYTLYILFQDADKNFAVCIKSRVNIGELKREIKESKHKEEILMVLNKFCKCVKRNGFKANQIDYN